MPVNPQRLSADWVDRIWYRALRSVHDWMFGVTGDQALDAQLSELYLIAQLKRGCRR